MDKNDQENFRKNNRQKNNYHRNASICNSGRSFNIMKIVFLKGPNDMDLPEGGSFPHFINGEGPRWKRRPIISCSHG